MHIDAQFDFLSLKKLQYNLHFVQIQLQSLLQPWSQIVFWNKLQKLGDLLGETGETEETGLSELTGLPLHRDQTLKQVLKTETITQSLYPVLEMEAHLKKI